MSQNVVGFDKPAIGTLRWYAQQAKKNGQNSVSWGPSFEEYIDPIPLKEAIAHSLVVDGRVESSTVDWSNGVVIKTWYRIKIQSSGTKPIFREFLQAPEDLPPSVVSVGSDEIMLRVQGGTAVVDGITITQELETPLIVNKRYLLFVEPLGSKGFVCYPQTEPVLLTDDGKIDHHSGSKFAHRFDQYHDMQDVLNSATK